MKILVISPTYNEKENISSLIKEIFKLNININILIIDDNSPDGTADIVKSMMKNNNKIKLLEREAKMGLGTAYCLGFQYAIDHNYEYIMQIDADMSHNPKDILKFINIIKNHDVIIGSRYIDGVNVINWPMRRLLLSYFANFYARIITRIPIFDMTGGFKCLKIEVLKKIDIHRIKSQGYSFQIEMNFLAFNKGFKIKEIPIVFHDRTVGQSKMNSNIILEAIFMVPRLFFRKIFNKI